MKSKYSSIIWDWNGTLLNDVSLCLEIVNKILSHQGLSNLEKTDYLDVFGFPISEYYKKIGIDFDKISYQEITEIFFDNYNPGVLTCNLHSNVNLVLEKAGQKMEQQFILTAAHKESVNQLLSHFSIQSFFDYVEGLDNHHAESKIHRGLELIKHKQINVSETILIGDTCHDYEVAQNMGIDCILISNGHQSKRKITQEVNDDCIVVSNIEAVLEII